jgi:hypothetical protein
VINYQGLFHVGIRVPDLDVAMEELGSSLGLTWSETRENPAQSLWTPSTGLQDIHLRYTYSAEGPQHVELLEGAAGSFWDGNDRGGAHHVGVWVDDVDAESDRLIDAGGRSERSRRRRGVRSVHLSPAAERPDRRAREHGRPGVLRTVVGRRALLKRLTPSAMSERCRIRTVRSSHRPEHELR